MNLTHRKFISLLLWYAAYVCGFDLTNHPGYTDFVAEFIDSTKIAHR